MGYPATGDRQGEHSAAAAIPLRGDQPHRQCQRIYDRIYGARGEMENRIKEQQLACLPIAPVATPGGPISSGCCSQAWLTRCWRRSAGWHYTERHWLARNAGTLRLKLLRIGAIVLRNTRRIRLLLSSAYPNRELFCLAAARLKPG